MGWEKRGEKRFFYLKHRKGKKVVSEYIGNEESAADVASEIEKGRARRVRGTQELQEQKARLREQREQVENTILRFFNAVEDDFRSAMLAAGCYRHRRQWRTGRGDRMSRENLFHPLHPALREEQARRLFNRDDGTMIGRYRGDMSREVEDLLVNACSNDPFQREAIRRDVAERRATLAGDSPTAIEAILADRVALCWLEVHLAQREYQEWTSTEMVVMGLDEAYYQRRLRRADRRLTTACRAVAQFRRLAIATVQDMVADPEADISAFTL